MSLPHQSLYGAMTWLRPHLPGATGLKILGAFAGGVACTGIVMAWNGSQGSFFSSTEQAERPQVAVGAPKVPAVVSKAPVAAPQPAAATPQAPVTSADAGAGTKRDEAPATKPPETTHSSADAADKVGCEDQVWPYIEQRCLTRAESDSAPSRSVRIVSTDKTIAGDPTSAPTRTAAASAIAEQKPQTEQKPQNSLVPEHVTAALPIPLHRPDGEPMQAASAPASAPTGDSTPPVAEPQPAETRSRTRANEKRRQRRGDDRGGQRRDDRSVQPRQDADDDRGMEPRRGERDDRLVPPRQGRQVTVEQTYRLPDGRRVVVRRAYRPGTEPDLRAMPERDLRNVGASYYRRSYGQRFVAEDD